MIWIVAYYEGRFCEGILIDGWLWEKEVESGLGEGGVDSIIQNTNSGLVLIDIFFIKCLYCLSSTAIVYLF